MNYVGLLAALQLGSGGVPANADASGNCAGEVRSDAIIERHRASLPRHARVTAEVVEHPSGAVVSVSVTTDGETPRVERHAVNTCEEGYAFLDFYLSVWEPPPARAVSRASARTVRSRNTRPQAPPSVLLGTFGHMTTAHPTGLGFGAGLGLDLSLDEARLGAYGAWYQPYVLQGPPDKASYDLHRLDVGGNLCGKALASPVTIWPCLGASVRRLVIPSNQAGPNADTELAIASADAALIAARPLTSSIALEAALSVRQSVVPVDIGEFAVGYFSPPSFEVGFRLGLTWDLPKLFNEHLSSASRENTAVHKETHAW